MGVDIILFYNFASDFEQTIRKIDLLKTMKKLHAAFCVATFALISSVMTSCFDPVTNEYRVTVPTYATVALSDEGKVRLYLDENRGILTPNEKSEAINWGDAVRVMIKYDLPFVGTDVTSMENYFFKSQVRSAVKVDTVSMVDITDMEEMPSWLKGDTLGVFKVQAYRGYLTTQVWNATNLDFKMTYSYDRNKFDGKNLYQNLHYTETDKTWNKDFLPSASALLPAFLSEKGVVTSDTLNIHVIAPVWYDRNKDSAYVDTAVCRISKYRLTEPKY